MLDSPNKKGDKSSLFDIVERIRAEHYPDLDQKLVKEILNLHADPDVGLLGLANAVDRVIAARLEEVD